MDNLSPIVLVIPLMILSVAPFIAIMATAFLKISVVIFLIRNALGIQQIPPNMAINGLAIILSIYIMAPVGMETYKILSTQTANFEKLQDPEALAELATSLEPTQAFLMRHSDKAQRDFFVRTTKKLWPEELARDVTETNVLILLPAFTLTELTEAFEIGFLLYLPFIAIDLIISNILLAMGMMMVSPMTISLPFKLLLFVLVDGWTRLIHGLVLTYQ
jgi:type III secretion protein R